MRSLTLMFIIVAFALNVKSQHTGMILNEIEIQLDENAEDVVYAKIDGSIWFYHDKVKILLSGGNYFTFDITNTTLMYPGLVTIFIKEENGSSSQLAYILGNNKIRVDLSKELMKKITQFNGDSEFFVFHTVKPIKLFNLEMDNTGNMMIPEY